MEALRLLREGWTSLAAAVLPVECAGCDLPDVGLCAACAAALAGDGALADARPAPGCPPVTAVCAYSGAARAVLVAWKDHGRHDLGPVLGRALASAVEALPAAGPLLLVPAPSARRAVRRRGEDGVARLARVAAGSLRAGGRDVVAASVLRQGRRVRDQASLDAGGRAANLAGALRVARPAAVAGRACAVVDDVTTTGATLAEAARVLRAAGAHVVGAAVVAATARRFG